MVGTKRAILLIGPTGSGKTPLGDLIERKGWRGRRCLHFDFGAQLRMIGREEIRPAGLSEEALRIVREVLATGALLEEAHFYIAQGILSSFIERNQMGEGDWLVLNGLPRHVAQAKALEGLVRVELVVYLKCSPRVVLRRIRTNAGGDRKGREDDDEALVTRKLELFYERTLPLLAHYRSLERKVVEIEVGDRSTPEDVWSQVEKELEN